MTAAYIIGVYTSAFGKRPETGFKAFAEEALDGVLADAGFEDGLEIDSVWFANSGMGAVGQGSIRGQVVLTGAVETGRLRAGAPVINVENACASGSTALSGAWRDVLSGQNRVSLALGLEKLFDPSPDPARKAAGLQAFAAGADMLNPELWIGYYQRVAASLDRAFELGAGRSPFMDTYALQALWHMREHGSTREQLAAVAAKAHNLGVLNPNAQYRFPMTVESVLADRLVSDPFTRSMCAPIGDGAAAALICSRDVLGGLPAQVRARAVRIRACVLGGGTYREPTEPGSMSRIADLAFRSAGVAASDIDVTELHDATSFGELHVPEAIGLCAPGQAGRLAEAGETGPSGRMPINPSGGLVCRGHPVGATGLAMIHELTTQLRGEAGARQAGSPRLALAQNGGGVMGFDEAVTAITILEGA